VSGNYSRSRTSQILAELLLLFSVLYFALPKKGKKKKPLPTSKKGEKQLSSG
jgi:hypothetical protein